MSDDLDDWIDDQIDRWHDLPEGHPFADMPLHTYLGLSWGEYAAWVKTNRWPARLVDVVAQADLVYPKRDEHGRAPVLVLERVEPGVEPEYCVHGKVSCFGCSEWCWLGDKTYEVVLAGDALALCLECATKVLPESEAKRVGKITDHRRADGPH